MLKALGMDHIPNLVEGPKVINPNSGFGERKQRGPPGGAVVGATRA